MQIKSCTNFQVVEYKSINEKKSSVKPPNWQCVMNIVLCVMEGFFGGVVREKKFKSPERKRITQYVKCKFPENR